MIRVDSGKYVCEATNDVMKVQSNSATLNVQCKITIFYDLFNMLDKMRLKLCFPNLDRVSQNRIMTPSGLYIEGGRVRIGFLRAIIF